MHSIATNIQHVIQSLRLVIEAPLSNVGAPLNNALYKVTQTVDSNVSQAIDNILIQTKKGTAQAAQIAHSIPSLEAILAAAAASLLLLAVIIKFRSLSSTIKEWLHTAPKALALCKNLFRRATYRNIATMLDKRWSLISYRSLLWLRDIFNYPAFFRRPEILIDKIIGHAYRARKKLLPIAKFILFFIPGLRLTKPASKQIISALMDEGKSSTDLVELPSELCEALSMTTLTAVPQRWQTLTEQVVNRWENDLISGLLIEGGNGSGKTAFINWLKERYKNHSLLTFNATREKNLLSEPFFQSLTNLNSDKLKELPKQIVTIDDIELLFLRKVGGYQKIRELLNLIEKTKSRILWIVTANTVFCNFIRNIQPIEQVFPFHIIPPYFTAEEIYNIIGSNLSNKGYEFRVLMDKNTYQEVSKKIKRKQISAAAAGNYLKKLFFEKCYAYGIDNLHFHIYYFKRAIRTLKNKTVTLSLPDFFKLPDKQLCDPNTLHLLNALFLHRSLSQKQLVETLLLEKEKINLHLAILCEHNLVSKSGEEYTIFPPIYHQLLTHLKSKNISRGSYD